MIQLKFGETIRIKDEFIKSSGFLKDDAVIAYYYEYLDNWEIGGYVLQQDYKTCDKFIAYKYGVNYYGQQVPIIYKNDPESGETLEDIWDPCYYAGKDIIDGVTYDRWRKVNLPWDLNLTKLSWLGAYDDDGTQWGYGQQFVYTTEIVEYIPAKPSFGHGKPIYAICDARDEQPYLMWASDFKYSLNAGEIRGYDGYSRTQEFCILPDSFDNTKLTTIAEYGFTNTVGQVNQVKIPEGYTSIDNWAFQGNEVYSVCLPSTLKTIGALAFEGSKIGRINLPPSLETIDEQAFLGCTQLREIVIPASVTILERGAFAECRGNIYCEQTSQPSTWSQEWSDYFEGNIFWYRETLPLVTGNYWHYNEYGDIEIWRAPRSYTIKYDIASETITSLNGSVTISDVALVRPKPIAILEGSTHTLTITRSVGVSDKVQVEAKVFPSTVESTYTQNSLGGGTLVITAPIGLEEGTEISVSIIGRRLN